MRAVIAAIPIGITVLSSCATVPSGPAVPGYIDSAEVVQAQPLYRNVQVAVPARECWTERVVQGGHPQAAYTGPLVGGVIGGVVGHSLARGGARTPMTVAGTLIGSSLGRRLGAVSYPAPTLVDVRRCQTVRRYEPRQQIVGYRVDYRYEGQTFSTRTQRHPGRIIRVRVEVDPVDGS